MLTTIALSSSDSVVGLFLKSSDYLPCPCDLYFKKKQSVLYLIAYLFSNERERDALGKSHQEKALFVRLRLLEGVVFFYLKKYAESGDKLTEAQRLVQELGKSSVLHKTLSLPDFTY